MDTFKFQDLFILDIANNHQGDVSHAEKLIDELALVIETEGVYAAIKFQFRQLDTFIHPTHRHDSNSKHVDRFLSTALDENQYEHLVSIVRQHNITTMCTPFDEESVELIKNMEIEVIKIASCSVTDRPLLQAVVQAQKPVVVSTGGATINQIDSVVQLMKHNKISFALEHCVSIYPTPNHNLQLNQIKLLKERYPMIPIGWSTHENPEDKVTVQLAYAKGATLFERHVGLPTTRYALNGYSSSPHQISDWFRAHKSAVESCGAPERGPAPVEESIALRSLSRGVYCRRDINAGETVSREDVYFAFPAEEDGLLVSDWHDEYVSPHDLSNNVALPASRSQSKETDDQIIDRIMLQVGGMLRSARIQLNIESSIELSHHYGLARIREFGAIIIDVINREYCKKLIVQLPRQKHPVHHHKKKEETFQVLYGELEVVKNGYPTKLIAGDIYLIESGCWHKFSTQNGVIFEEISTTHFNDDSYYEDPTISNLPRMQRKTAVSSWSLNL